MHSLCCCIHRRSSSQPLAMPFISVHMVFDDFRPDLPSYGQRFVHAPNLEKFANKSLVFDRACKIVEIFGRSTLYWLGASASPKHATAVIERRLPDCCMLSISKLIHGTCVQLSASWFCCTSSSPCYIPIPPSAALLLLLLCLSMTVVLLLCNPVY